MKTAIYGTGGFAREVGWLLEELFDDQSWFLGYIDAEPFAKELNGKPIMTLPEVPKDCEVIVGLGDPKARERAAGICSKAGLKFNSVIDINARMSRFVTMGDGCVICAGSILTTNITIGNHVHINLDCTVGHDAVIEDFVTLSPGVHVSGRVRIGRGCYIGTGATIIDGEQYNFLTIAPGTVIAAGAVVTKSITVPGMYAGVPAVQKKTHAS